VPRLVRVAAADEIPAGRGKTIEVDGAMLAVFRTADGRYYAASALCPHEDGPLGEGALDGHLVICPWHAFDFDLRTGACLVDPDLSITIYPVRVQRGEVLVELP
jgi:NAD(P)H-dependent nitrite reductase small subunit